MNEDYFSNLSSIEEFYIKRDILGDKNYLKLLKKAGDYYWFVAGGKMYFLDEDGNLVDRKNIVIDGDFYCSNTEITSLEGAPNEVSRDFSCSHTKIISLKGSPKKVGGFFYCYETGITSLEGAPVEVREGFYCGNTKITDNQLNAYLEFLKNPTPEHIDETGHYKP